MTFTDFKTSLQAAHPPANISIYLESLWYDAKGNWDKAHRLIDSMEDSKAYHLHAYLHRKEGDKANASYWYRRAGKPMPAYAPNQEWEEITKACL